MGNIVLSGACARKAGANVSTAITEAAWSEWMSGAESTINVATRNNWTNSYTTMSEDVKYIIAETVSSLVAINAITYDMSGYTSRGEAEDMIVVLRDAAIRNISFLKDKKAEDFADAA